MNLLRAFGAYGAVFYVGLLVLVESFVADMKLHIDAQVVICVCLTLLVVDGLYLLALRTWTNRPDGKAWRLLVDAGTVLGGVTALSLALGLARKQALQVALLSLAIAYLAFNLIMNSDAIRTKRR